ncbi:hypothetical protein Q4485_11375 [Granulosicoccaceae sp. 1_MG-2023]|nr:hypothetical protein [Granulosicoccaceae sp. 1_MG-2023]
MEKLELYSEPFAVTGNLAGEGYSKLLGRPPLDLLQTVLRESVQNSLDATKDGYPPGVSIRSRVFTEKQSTALKEYVFRSLPPNNATPMLSEAINSPALRVLELADFNTSGLGGPTRADKAADPGEELDFVNFLRNVGASRDTKLGGGTYGYGKTSLYALSECSTILVDTQTQYGGKPVRRFMGCCLGAKYKADRGDGPLNFTGRHWWGRAEEDGVVDPLTGTEAQELADSLGLPPRSVEDTGTTIVILAPHLPEENIDATIVRAVLWNFWPRMCDSTPLQRKLKVSVEIDGESYLMPKPEHFPPLDLFAQAMKEVREDAASVEPIVSKRPKKHLGKLVITEGARNKRHPAALIDEEWPASSSHIALMRPVELVVKYLRGEPLSDGRFEWAGVFVCSDEDEVEQAFADAEPPTHDDWMPESMPKSNAKTYVNVALRELTKRAKNYAVPELNAGEEGGSGVSVAGAASKMGTLLGPVSGSGPGKPRSGGGGGSKSSGETRVATPQFSHLELSDGVKIAVFTSKLTKGAETAPLVLTAVPYLVVDGGQLGSADLPAGCEPQVHELRIGKGVAVRADRIRIGESGGVVECSVVLPPLEAAVGLKLNVAAADGDDE